MESKKMLNLLSKTMPWVVASLLVATAGFGQSNGCCPKPKPCCPEPKCCPPVCPIQLIPAYNHPARTDTRCPWDVNVSGSFIYWEALEDNLELGVVNTNTLNEYLNTHTAGIAGSFVEMNFKYKPGFKVGLGMSFDYDDWDVQSMYTWFHSTVSNHAKAIVGGANILPLKGLPYENSATGFNYVNGSWNLKMDIVDLNLGRWYYVGTKLTARPYFGARAAWIRQSLTNNLTNHGLGGINTGTTPTVVNPLGITYEANLQRSNSWAVGLESGVDSNWMLGEGFRVYGNGMFDIMFTRFSKAYMKETIEGTSFVGATYENSLSEKKVNTLRTHVSLEMGFGWGTFLDCNNWYLDFAAGYCFQAFYDQNMFRTFDSTSSRPTGHNPNGNLYVHGLTATVRLDF
jgi:hypothetical protein